MEFTRRTLLAAAGTSIALAGCVSGSDDGGDDTDDGGDDTAGEGGTATVQVRSHSEFGDILAGPDGMTLYNFDADTQGEGASTCYDDCAGSWPPLTVEVEPDAGGSVTADLATFEREDGSMQVTANGWPVYYFADDATPGDVNGHAANDVWWVLQPDGTPVREENPGGSDGNAGDGEDGGPSPGY